MKLKKFDDYLKKRLNPQEISEIESQVDIEFESFKTLQADVSRAVAEYMAKKKIGFNELVRRLDVSPMQVAKMQKGEANLTLSSLAHLAALFNKEPHIVFKDYVEIVENIQIRGYAIEIKYKKEESAVIDREKIKRILQEGVKKYMDKRGINISNVASIKSNIKVDDPFYSIEILSVKMNTGEMYFERETYPPAA